MSGAPRWYTCQLKPNGLAMAQRNLARQGIETFCPWQIETQRRGDRLLDVRRPLFPGYIFVRLDPDAGQWRAVNATRGLTRLVQAAPGTPRPLPDALIAGLLARTAPDGRIAPIPELAPGDRVRIISGPFADFVTSIESITPDARIRVLFEVMSRNLIVDLDPDQLRKTD